MNLQKLRIHFKKKNGKLEKTKGLIAQIKCFSKFMNGPDVSYPKGIRVMSEGFINTIPLLDIFSPS